MATFSGGRMVALFACMLFALNVSFAQDDDDTWQTVVVYMVDPIDERLAPEVEEYIEKWNDPLSWETFERDFTPAREGQMRQVDRENAMRDSVLEDYLRADLRDRGDGLSSWFPHWIPLDYADTTEDSLFKNILGIEGALFEAGPRVGTRQTLRDFIEVGSDEPNGLTPDGKQDYWSCDDFPEALNCRTDLYEIFRELAADHDESVVSGTPPVISFTIQARFSEGVPLPPPPDPDERTLLGALVGQNPDRPGPRPPEVPDLSVEFNWDSIRLLQSAAMDPDEYVIDTAPYWQPAAKPVSTEISSWGRIKATLADD